MPNYIPTDEPDSAFILENYRNALQRKKDETKRWWLVGKALEYYEMKERAIITAIEIARDLWGVKMEGEVSP